MYSKSLDCIPYWCLEWVTEGENEGHEGNNFPALHRLESELLLKNENESVKMLMNKSRMKIEDV